MKLLTIIGARPQFIKAATVSRVVADLDEMREVIVHTGQHYDKSMSDVFFNELSIPKPNHYLGIGGGTHGQMTGRQLEAIEAVMMEEKPDLVLVYGDTNSTLAGSLAAVKLHIPVAHVEAGLRSFNQHMPEEINRILTDQISSTLFVPTETAMKNLLDEGFDDNKLHLVGDVMFDASLYYRNWARMPDSFPRDKIRQSDFILATVHRAENTDDHTRLSGILGGLGSAGMPVILPLHPRTGSKIEAFGISVPSNIHVVPPASYLEMIWLETNCSIVATDSGGVQKEAFFFKKPCVTLRSETEWVELVENGWNRLAGADCDRIAELLQNLEVPTGSSTIYGKGDAAKQIVTTLLK